MVLSITSTQSLNAVKLCAPFQDTSTHERVVSNNPAVQLGAPTRDSSIYHTSWRAGRRRARWYDQHMRGQWRRELKAGNAETEACKNAPITVTLAHN